MAVYLVCGSKSWNRRVFDETISKLLGDWHFAGSKEELTPSLVAQLNPKAIFFLHWSWKVPDEITGVYECINFHMTDVPYGRGGSPLQNLILRGHKLTRLSALRMTGEMDAGPVYLKEDLNLEGSAWEILGRSSEVAAGMIARIIKENIKPVPQDGEVIGFVRRTPKESRIPDNLSPKQLYDFIRILDGEGYPRAFIESGGLRYEFFDAIRHNGRVEAKVDISQSS